MKPKNYLLGYVGVLILVCYSVTAQTPSSSSSASPTSTTTGAAATKQGTRPFPFHGMVSGVDQRAKTFTISGKEKAHVFKVTDKTVITKGAYAATIKDISENQEISGSYWKDTDGSLEAKVVKIGPPKKPTASPASTASPKSSPKS